MGKARTPRATVATARGVAATVVERVLRDEAFAAAALDAELDRAAQLDDRDRRLATELTYGTLRCRMLLERRIERFASRGLGNVDEATLAHLLVAAYQLLVLDRIPAFAAVSEAVELVRRARGEGMGRFANAVLRRLSDEVSRGGKTGLDQAVLASVHPWLIDRIAASLGSPDAAKGYVTAGPWPPPSCIRVRSADDRRRWIDELAQHAPQADIQAGKASPLCVILQGAGHLAKLPGHGTAWIVQEEGSQVVGLSLGARPGDKVLDACAGRGNKTSLLALQVGASGAVDAADLHASKLGVLRRQVEAIGASVRNTFAVDWSVGAGEVAADYDRVLVDAPCSGTGTLRRRPDLLARDLRAALAELREKQAAILQRAAGRCRPGGRIVYSVCSVLAEEAEQVVEEVLQREPGLETVPFDAPDLERVAQGAWKVRLLPHVHGTDGYFMASLRRRAGGEG